MAGEKRDPQPDEIEAACRLLQAKWTSDRFAQRDAVVEPQWTVPQYLVHHHQVGQWSGGRIKRVTVWRCVDGR